MIDISIYKDSDKDDQDFFKLEHVSTLSHTLSLKPPSIHDNNQSIGNTNEYLLDPFDDNSDTENTNGFRVRSSNASVWSVEDDEDWGDLEIPCSQTLTWIPKDHSTLPFSSSSQLKNNDNSNRNTFLSASHLCVDDDDEDFEEGFQFDSKENTIIQFPLLHHVPLHSHVDGFEKVDFPTNIIHHQDDTNTIQKKCFILALNPSLSNTTTIVPQSMESNKIDLIPLIFSESHTPFDTKHVDDSIDIDSIDIDNNDIDSIDIDNVDIDNVDIDNIKIDKVRIDTAEFDNVNEMNDESNEDKMMKKKPMLITLDMMNGMNQNISLQSSTSFDSFDELDEKNVDELDDQQKQNRKCGSNEEKMMKKKPMLITLDMMNGMNQKMPSIPAATLVQQKSNLTLTTKTKTPKSMTISKKQSHKTSEDQSKKDTKKKSSTLIKSSTTSTTNGTPNATLKSINPTPPPRNLSRQSSTEEIDKRKAWVSYSKASLTKPVPRLSLSNEKMSLKQHPIVKSKETSSLSNSREDLRKPPINSHPNSSDKTGTIHSGALHSTKVFVKRPTTSTLVKHGFNDTLLSRPHSVLSTNSVTNPGGPPERWSSGSTRDMKRPPTHRVAFGRTLKGISFSRVIFIYIFEFRRTSSLSTSNQTKNT